MIIQLIYFAIEVVVLGIVIWLLLYLIDNVPMGEPFHTVARVIVLVVGILILILLLLKLVGIAVPISHLSLGTSYALGCPVLPQA